MSNILDIIADARADDGNARRHISILAIFNKNVTYIMQEFGGRLSNTPYVVSGNADGGTISYHADARRQTIPRNADNGRKGKNMSIFNATLIHFADITTARRAKDGKKGDVTRRVQIPIAECTFTAADMPAARAIAVERMNAAPYADAVRVYMNADAAPIDAARAIAWNCLNNLFCRASFEFAFDAANSIIAGTPNADADDVISCAAMGLFDADAARAIAADIADAAERAADDADDDNAAALNAAADAIRAGECSEYFRRRAAYNAANTYLHNERAVKTTTARRDIADYFRAADADDDADDAAYNDSYMTPAPVADDDADAVNAARIADDAARAEYVGERRARRRVIKKAFGVMTERQRDIMKAYAATGSMRIAADVVGLKNQSTVCRHIAAARARVDAARIVNLATGVQDIGLRAADDADKRRAACIAAARAVVDEYARIDSIIAAAVAPAFGNDADNISDAVNARAAAYDNAANWTRRAAARELHARAAILDADAIVADARRRARERGLDAAAVNIAERAAAPERAANIDARAEYDAACETVEHDVRRADAADIERAERAAARRRRPSNVPTRDIVTPKNADAARIAAERDAAARRRAAAVVAAIAARSDAERAARDTFDAARKSRDVVTAEHAAERFDADMRAARREYDAAVALANMRYMYETTTPAQRADAAARVAARRDAERRARAFHITPELRNAAIAADYAADAERRAAAERAAVAERAAAERAAAAEFAREKRRADIAARADRNARARVAAARRDVAAYARLNARITMRSAISCRADISFLPRVYAAADAE